MRLARRAILSALAFTSLLSLNAFARTVTIIITGTVASGTDAAGVFGPAGTDLARKPFTLVFTFDDSKGKQTIPPCAAAPVCYSQIISDDKSSPGIANLQIGDSSPYVLGTGSDGSAKSQAIKHILPNTYDVAFDAGDRNGGVSVYIANTVSRPPAATNPDWRSAFVDKTLSKTPTVMSGAPLLRFNIINRATSAVASGVLTPATICVGDASNGCFYNPPKTSIASNVGQNPPNGSTAQANPTSPSLTATPTSTPTPAASFRQADITMTRRGVQGSEVFKNDCTLNPYPPQDPGINPQMPLSAALVYLNSQGLRLWVDQTGKWTPLDVTFTPASASVWIHFDGLYFPDILKPTFSSHLKLSSEGILTIVESGSADSFAPTGSLYSQLTGSANWSATQKIDLKTSEDTVTFTADLKAKYVGGAQAGTGKPMGVSTTCALTAHYSGGYSASDVITLTPLPCELAPSSLVLIVRDHQKQPNWCWAAVAEILMDNANPGHEHHQQCEQVEREKFRVTNGLVCGANGDAGFDENKPTKWDGGGNPWTSMNNFDFAISVENTPLPNGVPLLPFLQDFSRDLVKREISCMRRPMGFRWSKNGAHDMIIYGYYTDQITGALTLQVFNPGINPANSGGSIAQPQPDALSDSQLQHQPPAPGITCMYSEICTISYDDLFKPTPFTLDRVYFGTHKP